MFDLGDPVPLAVQITSAAGDPTNAVTVTLTITLPDGTTVSPAVANPPTATGLYQVDYVPVQAGRHWARWTSTSPTAAYTDQFDVRPAETAAIVSLADVRRNLNMTTHVEDEELRGVVEAATRVVEDIVGPVVVRSHTERHSGRLLVLRHAPVVAVTSVTPDYGPAYAPTELDVDLAAGLVRLASGGSFGSVTVVYTAGRRIVPANITEAAMAVVKWLWDSQRGPGVLPRFGEGEVLPTGAGWSDIPNRARRLLAPDAKGPLVA